MRKLKKFYKSSSNSLTKKFLKTKFKFVSNSRFYFFKHYIFFYRFFFSGKRINKSFGRKIRYWKCRYFDYLYKKDFIKLKLNWKVFRRLRLQRKLFSLFLRLLKKKISKLKRQKSRRSLKRGNVKKGKRKVKSTLFLNRFIRLFNKYYSELWKEFSPKKIEEDEEEEKPKKISHFKPNIVLSKIIGEKERSYLYFKKLLRYKSLFISNFFVKSDPIFFSFLFNKFLTKSMLFGKKSKVFFIVFSNLLLVKFFTALRPLFLFFAAIESSRVVIGHIPKNVSGRIIVVPTYLYFDKQLKLAINLFLKVWRKKQDFNTTTFLGGHNFKTKRLSKLSSLFVKNQKIYFSKFSKYTQRRNSVFDVLKKDYYLYLSNRSNTTYRWR